MTKRNANVLLLKGTLEMRHHCLHVMLAMARSEGERCAKTRLRMSSDKSLCILDEAFCKPYVRVLHDVHAITAERTLKHGSGAHKHTQLYITHTSDMLWLFGLIQFP